MKAKLAVSNLAWPKLDDDRILACLAELGVQGVEVAPTRLASWADLTPSLLAEYRSRLESFGLATSSLQALLFGRPELRLLGDTSEFEAMLAHMRQVIDVAANLGAKALVFGSPRNRSRGEMELDRAWALGQERLRSLGEIAADVGVTIAVEPVPPIYGGDFLTRWDDVLRMVKDVDNAGVRVHLDTSCVFLGGDAIDVAISTCAPALAHFHAAQPQLGSFADPIAGHAAAATALQGIGYSKWVAIEMMEQSPDHLAAVEEAVRFVRDLYFIERK
jgi:sugar phosphate isomerase/epimerase